MRDQLYPYLDDALIVLQVAPKQRDVGDTASKWISHIYAYHRHAHSLLADMNYFGRVVGHYVTEKQLKGWFNKFLSKQWKKDNPNFKLNKHKACHHPTKIDRATRKKKKMWRYKTHMEGRPIYHGEPFLPNLFKNFICWEFDSETREAVIHCKEMHHL